jgi:hypothetical protein
VLEQELLVHGPDQLRTGGRKTVDRVRLHVRQERLPIAIGVMSDRGDYVVIDNFRDECGDEVSVALLRDEGLAKR